MKTLTGNKIVRKEGDRQRTYTEIKCECCGALTHERRTTRIQKALQAACKTCRSIDAPKRPEPSYRQDGRTHHPLYKTYTGMKQRCYNPNHKNYADYGGRGVFICPEWLDDFWCFVADVGERPEGHTLNRINNDGGYEPSNCEWATYSQQMSNRRTWTHKK